MSGNTRVSKFSKFARNAASLTVGRVIGDLSTFLFIIYISRLFGQYELGQYSFAIAVSGFFMVISDYGLEFHLIKNLSKTVVNSKRYFSEVLGIRLLMTLFAYALLSIFAFYIAEEHETWKIILIVGFNQLLFKAIDGFATVFVAEERMHLAALLTTSHRVLSAVAVILMLYLGYSFFISLCMFPVISIAHTLAGYLLVQRRLGNIFPSFSLHSAKKILKESTPLALSELMRQVSTRTDVFIIGLLVGMAGAGVYNAAFRIIFMLSLLFYLLSVTIMPTVSKLHEDYSNHELKKLFNSGLRALILLGMPMSAGMYMIAPEVIEITFGKNFSESVLILQLLVCLLFMASFKWAMHVFLISTDLQNAMLKSQIICASINIIGTILLVLLDGIRGAAIATIVSEIVLILLYMRTLKAYFIWPILNTGLIASILGSLAFIILLQNFPELNIFWKICVSCFVYSMVLICFKSIRKQEVNLLLQQLKF